VADGVEQRRERERGVYAERVWVDVWERNSGQGGRGGEGDLIHRVLARGGIQVADSSLMQVVII
jgi:hypothetical protein